MRNTHSFAAKYLAKLGIFVIIFTIEPYNDYFFSTKSQFVVDSFRQIFYSQTIDKSQQNLTYQQQQKHSNYQLECNDR